MLRGVHSRMRDGCMNLVDFFAGVMGSYRAAQGVEEISPEPENTYDTESELSQALSKIKPLTRED